MRSFRTPRSGSLTSGFDMSVASLRRASERRAEHLLGDLLEAQGWDGRQPPAGDVLLQHEYRAFPDLAGLLNDAGKSGAGAGVPDAIVVDRDTGAPFAVIEVKAFAGEIGKAVREAQDYARALRVDRWRPLAIGLAGTSSDEFELVVTKNIREEWREITYDGRPIGWIPTRIDLETIIAAGDLLEIRPSVPPLETLAARAGEINRLLREARIKDEYRPAVVAATMLSLWHSRGEIRRDPRYILQDINLSCREAFFKAGKPEFGKSLGVDEANNKLKTKARRIATILERLNVTVLTAEHDYLGQLYETFFRYTGGNTIGQYFTPRHVARMMADVCGVTRDDTVLDPACGTGGFLIACMDRISTRHRLSRTETVDIVRKNFIGFENEPITAALCVANMILRGDGSTRVAKADCLATPEYPYETATVALTNPPFPHAKTDTPVETFVSRALDGLKQRGKLAIVLPMSLLAKRDKGAWRRRILADNSLLAVCQLPDDLFQPFAAVTTAFAVIEKGVPHDPGRKTVFVRLNEDGMTLRKGVRVPAATQPNRIPETVDVILNRSCVPSLSGSASVKDKDEWAPGAYIPSAPADDRSLMTNIDAHLRRLASFYTRYAREIVAQRRAVESGDPVVGAYRDMISRQRLSNAQSLPAEPGTIGGMFEIFYGMKELRSREGVAPGASLVVSPTEAYNGCYGWLEFPELIEPPFVTVAQTGSIGEAFVQLEPCAVNDDCLVLLPRTGKNPDIADLVLAAACIRLEKWRFAYGRKLTPSRVAAFPVHDGRGVREWIEEKLRDLEEVVEASLTPYYVDDDRDAAVARDRLAEIYREPAALVSGNELEARIDELIA